MGRAYEKRIARAQAEQAAKNKAEQPRDAMSHQEIESFVAGFALSAPARRQIVKRWEDSQSAAYRSGYDDGYEYGTETY